MEKLGINGHVRVVLDNDGTEIDDEDLWHLLVKQDTTVLLLEEGESWQPIVTPNEGTLRLQICHVLLYLLD